MCEQPEVKGELYCAEMALLAWALDLYGGSVSDWTQIGVRKNSLSKSYMVIVCNT